MTFDSLVVEICKHSLNVRVTLLGACTRSTCGYVHVWVCTCAAAIVCVCVYVKFEVNIVQCMIL